MQLQWRQSSLSSPQPGRLETLFYWQWSRSLLINVRYFFSLETLWCVLLSHPFSTQSTQLSEILPISHGSQQCQFLADFSNICTGPGRLGEWGTKLVSSGYNIFLISKNNLVIIKYISVIHTSQYHRGPAPHYSDTTAWRERLPVRLVGAVLSLLLVIVTEGSRKVLELLERRQTAYVLFLTLVGVWSWPSCSGTRSWPVSPRVWG